MIKPHILSRGDDKKCRLLSPQEYSIPHHVIIFSMVSKHDMHVQPHGLIDQTEWIEVTVFYVSSQTEYSLHAEIYLRS